MSKLPTPNKRPTSDNGGSLQQFLRSRGRRIFMPVVKQGEGRNGIKRARAGARKTWRRA